MKYVLKLFFSKNSTMKVQFWKIFFLLYVCVELNAQDTVFVRSYELPERGHNIDSDGRNLIVRTTQHVYRYDKGNLIDISPKGKLSGRYTWIKQEDKTDVLDLYHTDLTYHEKHINQGEMERLLPGGYHYLITKGMLGDKIFVNYRGKLLEYQINRFYSIIHRKESIRHVLIDDSIQLLATYSGIYNVKNNGSIVIPGASYSSGEISKIDDKYFLCEDRLYLLIDNRWELIMPLKEDMLYRRLLKINGEVYFFANKTIGKIDLKNKTIKEIIYKDLNGINDVEFMNENELLVSTNDRLLILSLNGIVKADYTLNTTIYDICISKNRVLLSTEKGLYEVKKQFKEFVLLFEHPDVIQSILIDNYIFLTTFDGFYAILENKVFEIIPNVEFNRMALIKDNNEILAGSIEGLYILNKDYIIKNILKNEQPVVIRNEYYYPYLLMALAFVIVIALGAYYLLRKKNQVMSNELKKSEKITPENIRKIMFEQEQIISVEALSDYFETSTVQLNRKLSKFDTTGLKLMKEVKKEIAKEMFSQNIPLDKISKRIGYQPNFIKRHFLKDEE